MTAQEKLLKQLDDLNQAGQAATADAKQATADFAEAHTNLTAWEKTSLDWMMKQIHRADEPADTEGADAFVAGRVRFDK